MSPHRSIEKEPRRILAGILALFLLPALAPPPVLASEETGGESPAEEAPATQETEGSDHGGGSRLTDEVIPLQVDAVPERPRPPIDWGNNFLGTGTLWPGFRLPTGAWWQPALLAFGNWRNAVQTFDDDVGDRRTEARSRLDLFFNLALTGSERLVVGFRPLDKDGAFTRYVFEGPGEDDGFVDELDGELESLFFEGDFGEIFPELSVDDFKRTDIGFSVGRQPLVFQEGQLISDALDSLGLTRNTLLPTNTSNFRATGLVAWGNVHRLGVEDKDAQLYGILTSTDLRASTLDVDVAYVASDGILGDQISFGASFTQRISQTNSTFRILGTFGLEDTIGAVDDGGLAYAELSWTPHHTHDLLYLTGFVAVDTYVPAARQAGIGGPLANAGISFAGSGLGFPGPLSSEANDVGGFALGYQKFSASTRQQVIFEAGARLGIDEAIRNEYGGTVRWQMALRHHYVLLVDAFGSWREGLLGDEDRSTVGGRIELVTKF